MWRFLADENFNGEIVRGLLHQRPTLDLLRVQDVGLKGLDDPDILAWAAAHQRVVLTHDRATMPDFAFERLGAGEALPGLFVLNDRLPVSQAIRELALLMECSESVEWNGCVVHLPL
jgi:hypothetical protein